MKQLKQTSGPLQNIARFVLSGLCVIFAIILWLGLNPSESTNEKNGVADINPISGNKKVDSKEFIFPKITEFDEIIQRPLFNKTRLPFVAPKPKQTVAKPKRKINPPVNNQTQLSLSAVVMTPDTQIAILQSGRNKTLQRVALGESIDGWSVNEITPHSVQLKKGAEIKQLELEIKSSTLKPEGRPSAKTETTVKAKLLKKKTRIKQQDSE